MDHDPDIAVIEETILADAGKESSALLSQARKLREEKLAAARREALREQGEILARARAQAEGDRKRLLAEAASEARNLLLLAREQAVDEAFTQVREQAEDFRKGSEYRAALVELIGEAARAVARPEMEAVLSPRDFQAFGPAIAGEAERELRGQPAPAARIIAAGDGADEPGALVRAEGGRIIFDNTFSARLRRLAPYLRRLAYSELFGGDSAASK